MTGCAKTMSDCPGRVEIWQIFSTCKTTGQRKNLLEKAAFWQEVKVVCCLHAKLITFQCTHVTDDDFADRLIGNYKTRRRIVAVPNVCLQTLTLSLESSLSSRFFHSFPKQRARSKAMPKQSIKASLGPVWGDAELFPQDSTHAHN